ncbi:MAG TPA: hypothetical protein VMB79_14055 [Jatrophihabitans sp.]|nr:hypothetical protein [Jatrophihabitans sp.]
MSERRTRALARGLVGVTGAGWLGNLLSYLLVLLAARRLGADGYASLVTLINLLLIGSVPSFALQAVGARRMATGQDRGLWQAGLLIGAAAGLLVAAIAPALRSFLHLPSLLDLLLVAVALPAAAVQGLCQGVVQGEQRFTGLAVITFVGIAGKSLAGLVGLLLAGTATGSVTAIAIGVNLAAAGSVWALPELRRRAAGGWRLLRPLVVESVHASHAYGIFLVLSVADVLLARHVLPTHAAAVYAAGSILTKGILWLPQSVANVLFAALTDPGRHHRVFVRAVAAIAGLGAAITLACWPFGWLAAEVVAGDRYPELASQVWLYALLGSCLAVVQFTLVAGLAVRSLGVTALIWLTVAAETVAAFSLGAQPAVHQVIGLMCLINLVAAGCAVTLRLRPGRRDRPGRVSSRYPAMDRE